MSLCDITAVTCSNCRLADRGRPVVSVQFPALYIICEKTGWLQRIKHARVLYFVGRASRYKFLVITNLTHFFLYLFIYFVFLRVSSVTALIIRRSNCINTSSGMISLCRWLLGMPVRRGLPPDRHTKHLHRLIIPDDVLIQYYLLMTSAVTLETCRDMK